MNPWLVAMNRADCFCLTTAAFARLRNNMTADVKDTFYSPRVRIIMRTKVTYLLRSTLCVAVLNVHSKLNNKQGQNIVKTR